MSSVGAAHVEFVLPAAQLAQFLNIACDVLKVFLRIVGQAQSSLRLDEANPFERGLEMEDLAFHEAVPHLFVRAERQLRHWHVVNERFIRR